MAKTNFWEFKKCGRQSGGEKVQGSFVLKYGNSMQCDFFKLVSLEEGREIKKTNEILALIKA